MNTSEINFLADSNDVCRSAGRAVFPPNVTSILVERIYVTDSVWRAALVCTDENQITREQRVAVEALLVAVLPDIKTPSQRTGFLIQGVELTGA